MLIFEFLKKLFGWADEAPRKRRAISFSFEDEFVTPKKHRCDYKTSNTEEEFIEFEEDSDSDEIEIIAENNYSPIKMSNRLNGTHGSKNKPIIFCTSSKFSSSKQHTCHTTSKMGCFSNKSLQSQSVRTDHNCPTLSKTHRLKERNQYEELLQNFLPRRIQVMSNKHEEKRSVHEVIDVIDLEKPSSSTPSSKVQQIPKRNDKPSHSRWSVQSNGKKTKENIVTLENNKNNVLHSTPDEIIVQRSDATSRRPHLTKQIERVATNTLRDQLAAKAVMKESFIPEIAKRYDERIEQHCKEAEELKRMTCVLSKLNRLSREAALEEHLARSMRLCEIVLDDREEPEELPLPTLTESMTQVINNALISRPPDEVLVEGFGLRITRKDIHTLAGLNWLNDEVINFYMNLLIARCTNDKYPKVHAMNTFFYPKLISGGHTSLKRWTRKTDIFAQDLIVVPIHLGMHWCMSIIDFRNKSIHYYDSMGSNNPKCLIALRQYLEDESLDKKKQVFNTSGWKLECAKDIPQQMNGSDCGVFACMFAEYICANRKITFTQQNMPYFRNKMVYEILKSKLL